MHMADALISTAVGSTMLAAGAASVGYSVSKLKNSDSFEKKIPVTAVMSAFVFTAQMINFTIPGTGSSGHIGGGVLLAAVLGGPQAALAITAVLIIQCLFFADGGLLALGCNIINLGAIPCLIAYPLIFKRIVKNKLSAKTIAAAAVATSVIGLQIGSLGVVLQTFFSGISSLPFGAFLLLMQPIHLAIGIIEGVITAFILCFIHNARPELLDAAVKNPITKSNLKKTIIIIAAAALITGGIFSRFASVYPDGLEWSVEKIAGDSSDEHLLDDIALMPGYDYKTAGDDGSATGASAAGLLGGVLTFTLAGLAGFAIRAVKRKNKSEALV